MRSNSSKDLIGGHSIDKSAEYDLEILRSSEDATSAKIENKVNNLGSKEVIFNPNDSPE